MMLSQIECGVTEKYVHSGNQSRESMTGIRSWNSVPRDLKLENIEGYSQDSCSQKLSFCILSETHAMGSLNLMS